MGKIIIAIFFFAMANTMGLVAHGETISQTSNQPMYVNSEVEIVSLDIENNGFGSAYETHSFSVNSHDKDISEIKWTFSLKNKDGIYEIVHTGDSTVFKIPEISNPENFDCSAKGELDGIVELSCNYQGKVLSAIPYCFSLELKPIILGISEMTEEENPENDTYQLKFYVDYRGSDYITVSLEEEYNSLLYTQRYDEPERAHIVSPYISPDYHSWLDLIVTNQYGEDLRTIELMPKNHGDIKDIPVETPVEKWNVYDSMGHYLGIIDNKAELKNSFGTGLFLLKSTGSNHKVCKVIIK